MTLPVPIWMFIGAAWSLEASNVLPSFHNTPV